MKKSKATDMSAWFRLWPREVALFGFPHPVQQSRFSQSEIFPDLRHLGPVFMSKRDSIEFEFEGVGLSGHGVDPSTAGT